MSSPINKPHLVLLPYPAQGHVNPFMQLAKLLYTRGFHITFVNTEFNHARFIRSNGPDFIKGLPDFRFETIPDGLPPSENDSTQEVWALSDSLRKNGLGPFKELLVKLNSGEEAVSCIIADGAMSFAIKAGEELGIKEVQFWTASACGLMGYLQFRELIRRGIIPFKDDNYISDGTLDTVIDWIPRIRNMRFKDIPSFIRTTNGDDIMLNFLKDKTENCLKASTIIFNTFDEFEHQMLQEIAAMFPNNIYNIGPLTLLQTHIPSTQEVMSLKSNFWKEDKSCLKWLDQRQPNSVLYVNYGSHTIMSEKHFEEFAWGLANSNHPFLWIVRADAVIMNSKILPKKYYEKIKDRGFLTTWCPQEEVISHPSIGAFLTHCGWNSTMESISSGVPLLCWPFFGEQPTNCRFSCDVWGVGMEVNSDVKREEIEVLVREMMQGEKGKQVKARALEWKKKAKEAVAVGGSSRQDFDKFINQVLLSSI